MVRHKEHRWTQAGGLTQLNLCVLTREINALNRLSKGSGPWFYYFSLRANNANLGRIL